MQLLKNQQSLYLLVLLIAADLAFIALGIIYECGFINLANICKALNFDSYFSLTRDRGYAEVFQYLKEYWLIILFSFLAITKNTKVYLGWAFLSTYLLLDDSLEIHERLGAAIADKLNFSALFGLRPIDYGELFVFAVVGLVFFLWLSMSYRASNSQERIVIKYLIAMLFGLAIFGIFVDALHVILDRYPFWNSTLGIVEDGGEHIVMSMIVWFVVSLVTSFQQSIAYRRH